MRDEGSIDMESNESNETNATVINPNAELDERVHNMVVWQMFEIYEKELTPAQCTTLPADWNYFRREDNLNA